tara:strand:- start:1198 stop:1362 length:165 start_codon:yes stop_codon:yes gene_type:complete
MFQQQFRDLLVDFLYMHLKEKVKTKSNLKKTITTFEDMWLETLRENKKNDKRKV